jgi:hypothetical protein
MKCFACVAKMSVASLSAADDAFAETFNLPSLQGGDRIVATQSLFHDYIAEEEKEADERMSTIGHRYRAEVTHRRQVPNAPVLNHGGTSLIERRQFGDQHLLPQLEGSPAQDNNSTPTNNIEDGSAASNRRAGHSAGSSVGRSRSSSRTRAAVSDNGKKKRRVLQNPVSMQEMRDGIVDKGVFDRYVGELVHFLTWVHEHHADLFTEFGMEKWEQLAAPIHTEKPRNRHGRIKKGLLVLLRNALNNPIIDCEKLTPETVMDFVSQQANQFTGAPLSSQGYGGKRSAIQHLVRCHNMMGHSEDFKNHLATLWKGFLRASEDKLPNLRRRRRKRKRNEVQQGNNVTADGADIDEVEDDDDESVESDDGDYSDKELDDDEFDDSAEYKTGKVEITPELFRNLCRWCLEWGTADGIFGALFFCMTWNLVCRGNNTAKVRFSHMTWTTFDAMKVNFRHTKTEKHKQGKRKKRALFSNPFEYYIDFPFLLGLYLATNFSFEQTRGRKLFPGSAGSVADRVAGILARVLKEHEAEVLAMGYDSIKDIGIHSFRKGNGSFLASLPGGPSPAAICLRAGWSMGQVRDIYFQQTQAGDEFVGRCASLLNMTNGDFATTPAFFPADTDDTLLQNMLNDVFPHFTLMDGMERILRMCLASLLHHREKVKLFDPNHIARNGISIFRNMTSIADLAETVKVERAWESQEQLAITGVPPHIKQIVDLKKLLEESAKLPASVTKNVMEEVREYFERRGIGGGELTEARVNEMIDRTAGVFARNVEDKLEKLTNAFDKSCGQRNSSLLLPAELHGNRSSIDNSNYRDLQSYPLRMRKGKLTRLPEDFEFPSSTPWDCWVQWNEG